MAANGTVGRGEVKNGLARFLRHRHQAPVVLDGGEVVLLVLRRRCGVRSFAIAAQVAGVCFRHSIDPFVIRSDGTAQDDAVLLHYIPCGLHGPIRQWKVRLRPVIPPPPPVLPPLIQRRSEIAQALERKQVGAQRNDEVIGGNQCGAIDCAEIGADVDQDDRGVLMRGSGLHDGREGRQKAEGAIQLASTQCVKPMLTTARLQIWPAPNRRVSGSAQR